MKRYQHNPSHLFLDDAPYFLTAAIYEKRPLLQLPELKYFLRDTIRTVFAEHGWSLAQWVILDNHYHLMGQSRCGKDLSRIMHDIHFLTAGRVCHEIDCTPPIWWNYWDYCPRNDRDYMTRQNYLLYNPVKHGYVANLKNYPCSSFHEQFAELGREALAQKFRAYPEYKALCLSEAHNDDF